MTYTSGYSGGFYPQDPKDQMAYNAGQRARREDEHHRQMAQEKGRREKQQEFGRQLPRSSAQSGAASSTVDVRDMFEGLIVFGAVSGVTVASVLLWNGLAGQFNPANPLLANLLGYGGWGVGAGAITVSLRFHALLTRYLKLFLKVVLAFATLFFGSALIYGLYQSFTAAN